MWHFRRRRWGRWDETWRETGASPIRAGYVRKRSHDASRLNRRHDTRGGKTQGGEGDASVTRAACVRKVPVDPCFDPPGFFVLRIMKIIVDLPGLGFLVPQDVAQPRSFHPNFRRRYETTRTVRSPHIERPTSGICHLRSAKIDCLIESRCQISPDVRIIIWTDHRTSEKSCCAVHEIKCGPRFKPPNA